MRTIQLQHEQQQNYTTRMRFIQWTNSMYCTCTCTYSDERALPESLSWWKIMQLLEVWLGLSPHHAPLESELVLS